MKAIVWLGLFLLGGLAVRNSLANGSVQFWDARFIEILNVAVVILLIFYFAEMKNDKRNHDSEAKNDERRKKEAAERLIEKLLTLLEEQKLINIETGEDVTFVTIKQREIRNKLDILEKYNLLKPTDMDYMKHELNDYWIFISEKIGDIAYLNNSANTLKKHISNIQNKLEECIAELYN